MADFGNRAGRALGALFPGPHRDKAIARAFGITTRMARYLRSGNHWSARRLTQAADMFGDAFEAALSRPDSDFQYGLDMQDLERRMARVERHIGIKDRVASPPLAPQTSGSGNMEGRGLTDGEPAPSKRSEP